MKRLISLLLATVLLLGLLPLAALADNNLVLHYDFQNGAGDTLGNGYDGTIQADSGAAAVLTETGGKNNGAALELTRGSNGAGGYVELPVAALTAITGDWSMNLWVKLTDNPTWNHIFSMGTDKNHYALLATVGNPYGTPVGLTMGINNGSGEYRVAAAPADTVLPGSWETSLHPIGGTNADYPQSEGPNWAKSYADGKYYIYTDEFTGGVTYYSNDDITDDYGWEYRQAGEGSMAPDKVPNLDYADQLVSHCGLISVTQKEIDHLVEYWGVTSVEKGIFFTVLDAENPEAVTVTVGTAAEDLELPQTVRVQYDDGGGWRDVTVAWDTTSYQPTEGTYTLTGAITLAEDVKNPDGIAVALTVQVQPESHNLVFVPAKESTCVEQGNVAHWHCDHCSQNFTDAEATKVLENVTLPLDKDNHQHTALKNQQYATPDHPGYTGDLVCTDCNTVLRWGKVIPKKAPIESAAPVEPEQVTYTDVAVGSWYEEAVAYVAKHGLMTGVGNGRFNPDGAVTRAMVWTVLARMAGEDTDGGATWYSKAQIWAMETGVSDGTKPMESITREQLAAMLYRFEGSPKVSGNLSAYPDGNTVSDWAADAMVWATETGLINGINGYLKPQSGATRAQLATMLMRFTA